VGPHSGLADSARGKSLQLRDTVFCSKIPAFLTRRYGNATYNVRAKIHKEYRVVGSLS